MSMETHVFFRGKLPSKAALSRAMKELGFPYSIKLATGSLEQQNGFMPMLLRREETGVEFDVFGHDAVEEFADAGVDPSYERVANFRWGGDFQEAVAGMCGAAALAMLVNGVVFDEAENRLLSVEDAIDVARANLKDLPPQPKQRSPRGRTLLKRMLAPLLAKRSDLALVGDLLVIRPVRHLIRGVEFRWHERQTVCSACPFIQTLYQNVLPFMRDAAVSAYIENPIFAPMLFDRLAEEIFEPLGKIATIEDFIESKWGKHLFPDNLFPSILLSRGIEQARTYIAPFEANERTLEHAKERLAQTDRGDRAIMYFHREAVKDVEAAIEMAKRREQFLAGDPATVFAHYRAWETEVVRALKLKEVWESSPFPAELPTVRRAVKSADPIFPPTPWLDFPDTWHQDPPETPGEVRYSRSWWDQRHGRVRLIDPITRAQAEECHRNFKYYVLATRLSEGQLLILTCSASLRKAPLPPNVRYLLWLYDTHDRFMMVEFDESYKRPGTLKMRSLKIETIDRRGIWHSFLDFDEREKSIHDDRGEERLYEERKLTRTDRSAYIFPPPRFGDFDVFWQRISMYLRNEGFGAFA
jgi:hypothetical protein